MRSVQRVPSRRGISEAPSRALELHAERATKVGWLEYSVALLLVVVPAMGTLMLPNFYFNPGLPPNMAPSESPFDILKISAYLSAPAIAILFAINYQCISQTIPKAFTIILFVAWCFVTCLWAPEIIGSFNTTGRMAIIVAIAIYLSSRFRSVEIIGLLTNAFAISITASLIAVIFFPRYGHDSGLGGYETAWRGVMPQKNFLGGLMAYGVFVGYYSLLFRSNSRILSFYVVLGSIVMTIMSQSATAIIATSSGFIFIILLSFVNNSKSGYEKGFSIWVMMLVLVLISGAVVFSNEIFQFIGRSVTLTGRSEIWSLVLGTIQERPFLGYGHTFWQVQTPVRSAISQQGGWAIAHAHNAYLDIWLQTGIIGLVLVSIFLISGVAMSLRSVLRGAAPIALFWSVIFFVSIAKSFTETQWVDPNMPTLFWTTLSFIGLVKFSGASFSNKMTDRRRA